jgi:5'(3')-deoxyribonucleotidase
MKFNFFIDMDGVLSDFDLGFKRIAGVCPSLYKNNILRFLRSIGYSKKIALETFDQEFWKIINSKKDFWETLPLMSNGLKFWKYIEKYNPTLLTACPSMKYGYLSSINGKRSWVDKWFGQNVDIIFVEMENYDTTGKQKAEYCKNKYDILIDDSKKNIEAWIKAGGTGILHTSVYETINTLRRLEL